MNISTETLTTLVDEIARLKTRVQEQNDQIEKLMDTINGMYDEIEALENDNADLKSALRLLETLS